MPRQAGGENDTRVVGQAIQDEIFVRRNVIHATLDMRQFRLLERGQQGAHFTGDSGNHPLLRWSNFIGINWGAKAVRGGFEPAWLLPTVRTVHRETVEIAADEGGEGANAK